MNNHKSDCMVRPLYEVFAESTNVGISEKTYTAEKRADWRNHKWKFDL